MALTKRSKYHGWASGQVPTQTIWLSGKFVAGSGFFLTIHLAGRRRRARTRRNDWLTGRPAITRSPGVL